MNERKYALLMYWGPFGHANNHESILKVNDLIKEQQDRTLELENEFSDVLEEQ